MNEITDTDRLEWVLHNIEPVAKYWPRAAIDRALLADREKAHDAMVTEIHKRIVVPKPRTEYVAKAGEIVAAWSLTTNRMVLGAVDARFHTMYEGGKYQFSGEAFIRDLTDEVLA